MSAITAPESDPLSIRRLGAHITRNLARTVGAAGLATLVLACATVCPASAHGGGGGGGHGSSMMGVSGFAGPTSTMSSYYNVGCINNRYSSRCAGNKRNGAK